MLTKENVNNKNAPHQAVEKKGDTTQDHDQLTTLIPLPELGFGMIFPRKLGTVRAAKNNLSSIWI